MQADKISKGSFQGLEVLNGKNHIEVEHQLISAPWRTTLHHFLVLNHAEVILKSPWDFIDIISLSDGSFVCVDCIAIRKITINEKESAKFLIAQFPCPKLSRLLEIFGKTYHFIALITMDGRLTFFNKDSLDILFNFDLELGGYDEDCSVFALNNDLPTFCFCQPRMMRKTFFEIDISKNEVNRFITYDFKTLHTRSCFIRGLLYNLEPNSVKIYKFHKEAFEKLKSPNFITWEKIFEDHSTLNFEGISRKCNILVNWMEGNLIVTNGLTQNKVAFKKKDLADIDVLLILMCMLHDGYYVIKRDQKEKRKFIQFLNLVGQLPFEIQELIIQWVYPVSELKKAREKTSSFSLNKCFNLMIKNKYFVLK